MVIYCNRLTQVLASTPYVNHQVVATRDVTSAIFDNIMGESGVLDHLAFGMSCMDPNLCQMVRI